MIEKKTQSLIFQLAQIILLGLFGSIWEVRREKSLGCREQHERWGQREDESPARPCPSGGTWARRWWPSRSHVCPAVREVAARARRPTSRLDTAAGAQWTVALILSTDGADI